MIESDENSIALANLVFPRDAKFQIRVFPDGIGPIKVVFHIKDHKDREVYEPIWGRD